MSIYPPLSAALVTLLLTHFLLSNKSAVKLRDVPNDRSLHTEPVPRIGGVSLMAGILSGWLLLFNSVMWWILFPMLGLFLISLLDDIYKLTVKLRLLSHILAATILVVGSGLAVQQGAVIALVVIVLGIWMINLFNFMDGSDGLAGGMAMFGFGVLGVAAWFAHNPSLALLNFCIAASAAGFLYYNFHPAKIFMGDAGSIPLGFLVIAMSLWGWLQGNWSAWFPVLVFSPFIADASVTLLKRTMRGAKITEAHREHYYQRLVQLGWGHRNVALAEYALMLAAGISALWVFEFVFPWQLLLAWATVYAVMMLIIDRQWKSYVNDNNV